MQRHALGHALEHPGALRGALGKRSFCRAVCRDKVDPPVNRGHTQIKRREGLLARKRRAMGRPWPRLARHGTARRLLFQEVFTKLRRARLRTARSLGHPLHHAPLRRVTASRTNSIRRLVPSRPNGEDCPWIKWRSGKTKSKLNNTTPVCVCVWSCACECVCVCERERGEE